METETITTTTWIVWALVGFIGGFMVGRMKNRSSGMTLLAIVVGMIFAVVGGWLTCELFGAGEKMQYFSLVIAVLTTSIGLWLLSLFIRNSGDSE